MFALEVLYFCFMPVFDFPLVLQDHLLIVFSHLLHNFGLPPSQSDRAILTRPVKHQIFLHELLHALRISEMTSLIYSGII